MHNKIIIFLIFSILYVCVHASNDPRLAFNTHNIVISSAERTIDLSTQVVVQEIVLRIKNEGDSELESFTHVIPFELGQHLAWIKVLNKKDTSLEIIPIENGLVTNANNDKFVAFEVKLSKSLPASKVREVHILASFTHATRNLPEEIYQGENQLVVYELDSHYIPVAYHCKSQQTNIHFPQSFMVQGQAKLESYTSLYPSTFQGSQGTYGPYESTEPLVFDAMRFHYENQSPHSVITNLHRDIEVSHWGNVAVEQHFDIEHQGAKLVGEFSRLDFQMNPYAHAHVVGGWNFVLPKQAHDVYYRDVIGNISTSNWNEQNGFLLIQPRFPLFGGWKTQFYLGYNLPLQQHVEHSGNTHRLTIPFTVTIADSALVIDQFSQCVILPEGATNVHIHPPTTIDRQYMRTTTTYLDTTGRPTICMEKSNVVQPHATDLIVTYDFDQTALLRDVLVLVAGYFAFFLLIIVLSRIDLSIETK
mmetsp:Transcript_16580/g.24733  ORF Transcript_16580/g.24733 Transcript_16580/m.24733 type:complete len:475 (+) Transcript_16580:52-1476(+)